MAGPLFKRSILIAANRLLLFYLSMQETLLFMMPMETRWNFGIIHFDNDRLIASIRLYLKYLKCHNIT